MLITKRLELGNIVGRRNSVDEVILDMEYQYDPGLYLIKAVTNFRDDLVIRVNLVNTLVDIEFINKNLISDNAYKIDEEMFWRHFRL